MRVKTVALEHLTEDPQNARVHPERNMKAIVESLRTFGQVEPLVVRAHSNVVVGGNGRLAAMRQLGWKNAKVVTVDLDDDKVAALAIALNRTGELAEWDEVKLSNLLSAITEDALLTATGFDDKELRKLTADVGMEDFVKDLPEDPTTKPDAPSSPASSPSGDGLWFYAEFYGQEARFHVLKELLGKAMVNKHEIDSDVFERMVQAGVPADG